MPSTPTLPDPFDRIAAFENLHEAALEARKGERYKDETARFHQRPGETLVQLRYELLSGSYNPASIERSGFRNPCGGKSALPRIATALSIMPCAA